MIGITIGNVQGSAISIASTNNNPAVNEPYTIYGQLHDALSGAPLAGQLLTFTHIAPSGESIRMQTSSTADGSYTFTLSESVPGTYAEGVAFYGSADHGESSTMMLLNVGDLIPTTVSVDISNSNPGVNEPFTFSGYLKDVHGTPLAGRTIRIDILRPTGDWDITGHTTTDSNGYYSVTYVEQVAGQYRFEFNFMGDTTYARGGPAVYVAVGSLRPTTISMTPSTTNPGASQSFTLSGYLKDANGAPIAGKSIWLGRQVVGGGADNQGGTYDSKITDQNGYYSFVLSDSAGTYWYGVDFTGDQTYATSNWIWTKLTVGTLTPTKLTLTASTSTPVVNQPFTLSGILTDKSTGTPLAGKTIRLQRETSGDWQQAVASTTTDANGAYTFTWSESAPGHHAFEPTFDGAGAYASTYAVIGITVGT